MTWIRVVVQLLSVGMVAIASLPAPVPGGVWAHPSAPPHAGPVELSSLGQIPNLLQQIVEAVRKAVKEVEDDLRRQLCSSCPVSTGAVVVALLLAIGHRSTWRR
jgi:hypothetical protein